MQRFTHPFATRARRRSVAVLTAFALAAGLAGVTGANAVTTFDPAPNETDGTPLVQVVRDDTIDLKVDKGGLLYGRLFAIGGYSPQGATVANSTLGCRGDIAGTNHSPRSRIVVAGPGGTVLDQTSPAKKLGTDEVLSPQPAASATNYLGGPWRTTLNLAGKPAGVYTVTTTMNHKLRSFLPQPSACTDGTPPGAETTQTWQFEYRPWQHQFEDLLGTGAVQLNTVPTEFRFSVDTVPPSAIVKGAAAMDAVNFYALSLSASFSLDVPNPGACGQDPLSCLPETAVSCNPAAGCQPRLATIDYEDGADKLTGLFDLQTKAFAAITTIGGHTRVLVSGGTAIDGFLHDLLDRAMDTAGQLGIDLPALLDTDVDLNVQQPDGTTKVIRVNLLKGLEIFTVPNGPATGIGLAGPLTLGAGVILHAATWTGAPDPAFTELDGTLHSSYGYDTTEATALPAIPSLPVGLSALVPPGKIKHVKSRIPAGSGTHTVVLGADTHADPTTGLPVHLPLISTPGANTDDGIDFVGAATVISLDVCLDLVVTVICGGGGGLIGTGVATFGTSPLPVDFGSIPLIWGDELGLGSVMASVDGLVSDLSATVLGNAAVQDLLATVMAQVGSLPVGVPGLPLPGGTPGGTPGGGLPGLPGLPAGGLLGLPGSLPLGNLPLASVLSGLLQMF